MTTIEKYRVVVEIDSNRYAIYRESKFASADCVRLTDRGPGFVVDEEHLRTLKAITTAFDGAAESVARKAAGT